MTNLPDELRSLLPLLKEWSISDDVDRAEKLDQASPEARQALVTAVIPSLPAINAYLNSFGTNPPEEACSFGTLAEAAIEAQMLEGR
jgi:hypothetical protein